MKAAHSTALTREVALPVGGIVTRLTLLLFITMMTLSLGCRKANRPPDRPDAPDGMGSFGDWCYLGLVDESQLFVCGATDPDGDKLRYRVDWGDGDTSDWTEPERSGRGVVVHHSWHSAGTFFVRDQATDEDGVLSDWSEATAISLAFAWRQTYGGANDDEAASVQQTADGGYIVVGSTSSSGAGMADVWLLRVDERGARIWDKTFGGSADDRGCSVRQTYDGSFIVAGRTYSKGAGESDAWLIKTDSDGNVIWDRTFGGPNCDYALSVVQTFDGGFVVAGVTCSYGAGNEDIWLVRTDASGNEVWSSTFGGANSDVAVSAQQTSDRGYVITGTTDSYGSGGKDVWLVKTDSAGSVLWNKTFGGVEDDCAGSGQPTSDGGYAIVGTRGVNGGDVWLIKTDAEGELLWDKTMIGGTDCDHGAWVQQTRDGGYAITGYTYSCHHYDCDVWMQVTDEFGQGGSVPCSGGLDDDSGVCITQTSDGGYIVAGNTCSYGAGMCDFWVIKTGWALDPVTASQPGHGASGSRQSPTTSEGKEEHFPGF
jgi:hypothetical protein